MKEFNKGIMSIYNLWLQNNNLTDTEENRKEFIKIIENHYSK